MRKTKIVCTLGPASDSEERIHSLICAGMDVARFNFSHGSHESHKATFELVSRLREELRLPVATLLDTKGPEIRLGVFKGGKAELHAGQPFHPDRRPSARGTRRRASHHLPRPAPRTWARGHHPAERRRHRIAGAPVSTTAPSTDRNASTAASSPTTRGSTSPACSLSMPYISEQRPFGHPLRRRDRLRLHRRLLRPPGRRYPGDPPAARTAGQPDHPHHRQDRKRRRAWKTSTRSCASRTASWSRAATWAWRSPLRTCPSSRSC